MAFSSIPSLLIDIGKATKKEIFDLIKGNFDDHESRLNTVEGAASKITPWNDVVLNASSASSITHLDDWRVPFNFDLISAHVAIYDKGVLTGILEMDIKKHTSNDFSLASTIFTTKPSIDFSTASSFSESTNGVLDAGQSALTVGEYLFLSFTQLPTNGVIGNFRVFLIGEAS